MVSSGSPASGTRRSVQASTSTSSRQAQAAEDQQRVRRPGAWPGTGAAYRWAGSTRRSASVGRAGARRRRPGSGEPQSMVLHSSAETSTWSSTTTAAAAAAASAASRPDPATTTASSEQRAEEPPRCGVKPAPRQHRHPGGRGRDRRRAAGPRPSAGRGAGHRADPSRCGAHLAPPTASGRRRRCCGRAPARRRRAGRGGRSGDRAPALLGQEPAADRRRRGRRADPGVDVERRRPAPTPAWCCIRRSTGTSVASMLAEHADGQPAVARPRRASWCRGGGW